MINAVAGGGTLLTFPTLLAFGTSPVMANATSTLALVIGTSGGMFGNRQYISATRMFPRRRFTRTSCRSRGWASPTPATRAAYGKWSRFQRAKAASLVSSNRNCSVGDSTWPSQKTMLALSAAERR